MGFQNTYLYTVEGWPNLETVIPQLKEKGIYLIIVNKIFPSFFTISQRIYLKYTYK